MEGLMNDTRVKFTYTVPASLAQESGVSSVTLVHLTAQDEMAATKRSGTDPIRVAYELAKASLWGLDGKMLSAMNSEKDVKWQTLHPKIRSLVVQAYQRIHQPREEDSVDFLASEVASAG
jgi:hypothetical protein